MVKSLYPVLDPDDTEFASIDDRGEYYSYLHAMGRSILRKLPRGTKSADAFSR